MSRAGDLRWWPAKCAALAQRRAAAEREIKRLIGTSVDKVEAGSRLVQSAGSTMGESVSGAQRVTDVIGEVIAAATQQSQGIQQVNGAVAQLDQMTQQNPALIDSSAAAAESLRKQAERLCGVVGTFQLDRSTDGAIATALAGASRAKAVTASTSAPVVTPARTPQARPADAAQAVITQARETSRLAASPPVKHWESF